MIIHIIVSYDQNISQIIFVKMDSMSGCDIRLVFTFPPKDSTLRYKKSVHLWNIFPCIITLLHTRQKTAEFCWANAIVYWIKIQYVCSCIYWFLFPFWCQTLLHYNSWSYIMLFFHIYLIFRVGGRIIISVWSMEKRHRKFESQVNYFIVLLITRQSI